MSIVSSVKAAVVKNFNAIVPFDEGYSEEKLEFRQQVLLILFKNFGTGDYSNRSIYECADDWCKKQVTTAGLVSYYKAYYNRSHDNT